MHTLAVNITQKTSAPCVILWRASHHSLWSALSTRSHRGTPSTVWLQTRNCMKPSSKNIWERGRKKKTVVWSYVFITRYPYLSKTMFHRRQSLQQRPCSSESTPWVHKHLHNTPSKVQKPPVLPHCSAAITSPSPCYITATPGTYGSVIADRGYPSPLWSCLQLHCLCDVAPAERWG